MAPITTSFTDQSSDLTDFVINKGHGVKGLSETDLKTLPKQYIHPLEERINEANILPQESIPVVDMSKWDDDDDDKAEIAKSICEAAGKWGFFQVVNHCVLIEVLESVKAATHRYFGLSPEEKKKYSKELSPSNNVRFGTSFNTHAEKALEWKDYLSLFYVSDDEASAFWPPDCMNEVLEYMKSSETLIKQLLQVLMKGLNVNEIDGAKEALLMGSVRINLNYYPICPNPEFTVGVGRHSDVSSLTVLLQDNIGGLYVRGHQDNSWIHVPPINGSLIINIGDALQILSNGKCKSVEHCVIVNASKNRISVPIFVNPRPQDIISPLPEVLASGEEALYKPVLYSDYVKHFFRKAHDGKKTVDFAKIHKP